MNCGMNYRAIIDLVHPTHPSADSYLRYLMSEEAVSIHQIFKPASLREAAGLCTMLYQIIRLCIIEGKRKDAIWVLDLAYDHRPQLFETAAVIESYLSGLEKTHSKRELPVIKRKATAAEIEAGLDVDESGYLRFSPQLENVIRVTPLLEESMHRGRFE
jgi:hypothetical protein